MSELQRVARELVASLTEAARIAHELRAAAGEARRHASVAASGATRVPGLKRVAAMFQSAARDCDAAAERLEEARRKAIDWARGVAGGGSGGASAASGAGSGAGGADDGAAAEAAGLRARGVAEEVIAEVPAYQAREQRHLNTDWGSVEQDQPRPLTDGERAEVRAFLAGRGSANDAITSDLRDITGDRPGRLAGLEYSLKGEDRIEQKVEGDVSVGHPARRAVRRVGDTIRYTQEIPDRAYTAEVDRTVNALSERGYALVKWRNSWDGQVYRGINSQWRDPRSGYLFELQFHTPTSFYVKDKLTHKLYERSRDARTTEAERRAIDAISSEVVGRIPVPPGAAALRYEPKEGRRG